MLLAALACVGYAVRGPLGEALFRAALAQDRGLDAQAALAYVLEGGLVAAAVALLVALTPWLAQHPRLGRFARPGFAGLALAQLVAHDWSTQVLLARELVRKTPALLARLPAPTRQEIPRLLRRAEGSTPITVPGEVRALYLHQLAKDNGATRFGFGQVPGYAIAGTKRFDTLAAASGRANLERVMDLLDIRYLLIEGAQAAGMGMPLRSLGPLTGHVVVENEVRRPRAFVAYRYQHGLSDEQVLARLFPSGPSAVDLGAIALSGPGERHTSATEAPTPCDIERPVPEHVILHCQAARPGYAVLLDEWTRGWSATVDGAAAPLERADVVLRAVAIPAGAHRVEMFYRTPGLRLGAALALGGWLIFLGLWAALAGFKLFALGWRPGSRPPMHAPPS
jgi:hypothetical protein